MQNSDRETERERERDEVRVCVAAHDASSLVDSQRVRQQQQQQQQQSCHSLGHKSVSRLSDMKHQFLSTCTLTLSRARLGSLHCCCCCCCRVVRESNKNSECVWHREADTGIIQERESTAANRRLSLSLTYTHRRRKESVVDERRRRSRHVR